MAVELNDTTIPATYQLAERTGTQTTIPATYQVAERTGILPARGASRR